MANRSSSTTAVPEAKGAMDRFKFEVANELGVPLSDGYNGNLTSKPRRNRCPRVLAASCKERLPTVIRSGIFRG